MAERWRCDTGLGVVLLLHPGGFWMEVDAEVMAQEPDLADLLVEAAEALGWPPGQHQAVATRDYPEGSLMDVLGEGRVRVVLQPVQPPPLLPHPPPLPGVAALQSAAPPTPPGTPTPTSGGQ